MSPGRNCTKTLRESIVFWQEDRSAPPLQRTKRVHTIFDQQTNSKQIIIPSTKTIHRKPAIDENEKRK